MSDSVAIEAVFAQARAWNFPVTAVQVERIVSYFDVLLQWNARVNLTGARSIDELVGDHLPDSFALARLAPLAARVVDVGAGGGLPGVPFALLRPDCRTLLVEPRAKRTAFLATAKRIVGGGDEFEVARCRHDALPGGSFGVASSRATFPPEEWVGAAKPLLAEGGMVVVFSSAPVVFRSADWVLAEVVQYATGGGAPRWSGAFVPRGTTSSVG